MGTQVDRDNAKKSSVKRNRDRSRGKHIQHAIEIGVAEAVIKELKAKHEANPVKEWDETERDANSAKVDKDYEIVKGDVSVESDVIEVDASKLSSETIKFLSNIDCDTIKNRYKSLSPGLEKSLLEAIQMDVYSKIPGPKSFGAFIDRLGAFYLYSMKYEAIHDTWTRMNRADKMKYIIALCSHLDKGSDIESLIWSSFRTCVKPDAKRADVLAEYLSQKST